MTGKIIFEIVVQFFGASLAIFLFIELWNTREKLALWFRILRAIMITLWIIFIVIATGYRIAILWGKLWNIF